MLHFPLVAMARRAVRQAAQLNAQHEPHDPWSRTRGSKPFHVTLPSNDSGGSWDGPASDPADLSTKSSANCFLKTSLSAKRVLDGLTMDIFFFFILVVSKKVS
jgi:hypothetical protein